MIDIAGRVVVLAAVVTISTACGGDGGTSAADPETLHSTTTGVVANTTDESETSTTSILESTDETRLPLANETDLVILGSDETAVGAAVAAFDGEIVLVEEAGVFQVRFPVDSLSELREIEAELERQGFATQLAFADDGPPPPDGDS